MRNIFFYLLITSSMLFGQSYPDQHYVMRTETIWERVEEISGLRLSDDGQSIQLDDGYSQGYITLKPDTSEHLYNRGLPSWNGTVTDENSVFIIQMRFPYGSSWSPWLTAGYWKEQNWGYYGQTSYAGGEIDYDYVKLDNYQNGWQFKIYFIRQDINDPSPTIHKLSFFASDSRTTDNADFTSIINDDPEEIFIPTDFFYQYDLDPEIGGDICSPTSVSMALRSYDIQVDPVDFAIDTYDPYYHIFGMWPRVVQNASEFGLDGAVTRYRSWSETRDVLASGGRVVMSVGPPLYTGHLMMLAGFTSTGDPIVHDPAKTNGYGRIYSKYDLSHSWFDKGGISYTFYPVDSISVSIDSDKYLAYEPKDFELFQNFPNPFNPSTTITYQLQNSNEVLLEIYNSMGQKIHTLVNSVLPVGHYSTTLQAEGMASGVYFYKLSVGGKSLVRKMILAH